MKSLFEKAELRQVPVTGSHTQKFDMSIMSFQVKAFCCPLFKKFEQKTMENEQVLAKKRTFLTDYNR